MATYARTGGDVWLSDLAGDWSAFAADVLPRTDRGALFEEAGVNYIRNPIPAAPGTSLPTNWSSAALTSAGITASFTGLATIDGLTCQLIRFLGTTSGSGGINIRFESLQQIVAANGETWSPSCLMALYAGTITNINNVRLNIDEREGTTNRATQFGGSFKSVLTATPARLGTGTSGALEGEVLTGTGTNNATPLLNVDWSSGSLAIDMTLAVALPMMEERATPSPWPFQDTRDAYSLDLALPADNGPFDLTITFDDDSQQVEPDVSSGTYAFDTLSLDRPLVKTTDWRSV
jgi:hypothetical protein